MAKIDDLMKQVADARLRRELETAVAELKKRTRFGLVYENHLPEMTALPGLPITEGAFVVHRAQVSGRHAFRVCEIAGGMALVEPLAGGQMQSIPVAELIALQRFGEPIYPGLEKVGTVARGGPERAHHAVINAENYHAAQLLLHLYEGQVDCLYLDPPYNTGARDWTYNNDYVDSNDAFRHSKWLSFIEKRLRLAKRLLKPDSVLIVTIDEHEVHHLGVLLEELFPNTRRQMVTIVNNGAGVTQGGFSRVEEYALFCFLGEARPIPINHDLLSDEDKEASPVWFSMIRYGGVDGTPSKRPGMVFPIAVNDENRIVATGRTLTERVDAGEVVGNLDEWQPNPQETVQGFPVIWPYQGNGRLGRWQLKPAKLHELLAEGFVRVRPQKNGPGGNKWSVSYVKSGNQAKVRNGEVPTLGREPNNGALLLGGAAREVIPKTVWRRTSHDAGKWGSRTVRELLGSVTFDYAKSPYAVLDTLRTLVGNRPDALIVDFFAGSGTTLHATCLLNAEDDGRRRCILVTNNEVGADDVRTLHAQGHYKGDAAYEKFGIFQRVTRPRCEAAISGNRPDGTPVPGTYIGGRPMADGFAENVSFFQLNYLDPDRVDMGQQFAAIAPLLWLQSGAVGTWDTLTNAKHKPGFWLPSDARYGVCFRDSAFGGFCEALNARPDVTHAYLVTNSEDAYTQMRATLPSRLTTHRLYRDYLRSFRLKPAS